jgi:hypothetical protein
MHESSLHKVEWSHILISLNKVKVTSSCFCVPNKDEKASAKQALGVPDTVGDGPNSGHAVWFW